MVRSFSHTVRLKTKLEELEKATDEMEQSQKVVQTLANETDQHIESLDWTEEEFAKNASPNSPKN